MHEGIIKFYNSKKGFGFIISNYDSEVFFHVSQLDKNAEEPRPNDAVSYKLGKSKKGVCAEEVRFLNK